MPKALKQIMRRLRAERPTPRRRQFELRPVDALETRIMPTAIVAFTGTALTITSDTSDNNITVERIGGQLHVDANGGTISVLGSLVPEFFFPLGGAFNLTAKFSDGNDQLLVQGGLQLKSATVTMGDGLTNVVTFFDATLTGKLSIDSDDGTDLVTIATTSVTGTTTIDTGWNTDLVTIIGGTFTGATTIKTDLGTDIIAIQGAGPRVKFVGKLTITTGDDTDQVSLILADTKALSIDTGDSLDGVNMADVLVGGAVSVKTGGGTDQLIIQGVIQSVAGANVIDTGSDIDFIVMAENSFLGATTINLGSGGPNSLAIDDTSFNGAFTLTTQGFADFILIEQNTALTGATTFAKPAKFTLGIACNILLGTADPASITNFLSTSTFTGRNIVSTLTVTVPVSYTHLTLPTILRV